MNTGSKRPPPDSEYAPSQRARFYRPSDRGTGSTRRLSRGRRAWYVVVTSLARGLLRFYWWSCRVEKISGGQHLDRLRAVGQPAVICYWHQMHVFCAWYLFREIKKGLRVGFLISPSVTGEVPAAIARPLGATILRGSSTRSGGQALRDMYEAIKAGVSTVVTPDGPKGPLHEFKPGAILLARMSGAPIVPIAYAAEHQRHWNSWDRFIVPRPFTRISIAVGEPVTVPKGLSTAELPQLQKKLEATMASLIETASATFVAPRQS